jgi:hypothetical protein
MSHTPTPAPAADAPSESKTVIVVDWKALGKRVAIVGGTLAAGLLLGYALTSTTSEESDDCENKPEKTDESTPDEI